MIDENQIAVMRARLCGTFGKKIRDPQYDPERFPEEKSPERLLRAVNSLGNYIRELQTEKDRLQHELMNLKLRNAIAVAVTTAVLTRAPDIAHWITRLFQ